MSDTQDQNVTVTPTNDDGGTQTDPKPTDTKPDDGDQKVEDPKQEPTVPEKYEFQMPEGMTIDQAAADEFTAIAKGLKLSQEDAQKVAGVAIQMQKRQMEKHAETVNTWVETLKADKEMGGEALAQNLAIARRGLETFGSPELMDILQSTGFDSHPEFVRAFYKVGKAISEDRFIQGSPPRQGGDMAKRMFPNMN